MPAAEDWISAADHLLRNNEVPHDTRRQLEGRALALKGIFATERGDIEAAREAFESGERLLSLLGPSRDLALVQQNFGTFCTRTGDYRAGQQALASAVSHWRLVGARNGRTTKQTVLAALE